MIAYRTFHNTDPPKLTVLWHEADLGRGAAYGFDVDAFEESLFSQPYFDREGLIVAEDNGQLVGFAHAGFSASEDQTAQDRRQGVICVVVVRPDYRRRGIGRELIRRAESYLTDRGATTIFAGAADPHDPFYVGLYGGTRPAGFLDSDEAADSFARGMGYEPAQRRLIFQRDIARLNDPVSMRLVSNRRKTTLIFEDEEPDDSWWWATRYGRHEPIRGVLVETKNHTPLASISLLDLHYYAVKWQHRALGLFNLHVVEDSRRNGYAQSLLIEICRRLRQEMVTVVEIHCPAEFPEGIATIESAKFQRVDAGTVYRKTT